MGEEEPITIAEFIEELKKLDQSLKVMVRGYEGGYNNVYIETPDIRDVALYVHDCSYMGDHEDVEEAEKSLEASKEHPGWGVSVIDIEGKKVVKALIL